MSEEAKLDEFIKESENSEVAEPTVPDNWRVVRADEIIEITRGASPRPKGDPELFGGDIPWVKIGDVDVKSARYTGDTEDTVTEKGAKKSKLVDEGTLLVSNSGTCGYPVFAGISSCVHDGWLILRDYEDTLNPHYLYEYIRWKQNYLESLAPGSTQINLNTSRFGVLEINIPPLFEQRNIATVLYTVDQAIEKFDELIEQADRVKQGVTQTLLNEGVNNEVKSETESRFGKLPESWDLRSLKGIGDIAGRTAPEKDELDCWGGDIPWATPSEITSLEGQTISDTEEHLTEIALEKVSSNLLPPKSVLLTTRATIGECAVNTVEMTTNQGFKNFIPGEKVDTWYAYYRLKYEGDYLASLSKGSTFPEVGKDTVENFVIPVPPLEEQKEIGQRLRSVDDLILSYKSNKQQYKRLKRGLMQDLLSGTVRTIDTNITVPDEVAQHG